MADLPTPTDAVAAPVTAGTAGAGAGASSTAPSPAATAAGASNNNNSGSGSSSSGNNSGITLRMVNESDAPAIQAIYAHYVQKEGCVSTFEESVPDVLEMLNRIKRIRDANQPYIVAVDGAQGVIGYAYAGPFRTREAYRYTLELAVYLRDTHHGRGLARVLIERIITEARAVGCRLLVAVTASGHSVIVHKRLGFRIVGVMPCSGYRWGQWLNTVYLAMDLAPEKPGATNADIAVLEDVTHKVTAPNYRSSTTPPDDSSEKLIDQLTTWSGWLAAGIVLLWALKRR